MEETIAKLEEYFQNITGPWLMQYCVGDYDIPVNQVNYGMVQLIVSECQIDYENGRLNLLAPGGACSLLLSELYFEEYIPESLAVILTYNYAWAILSEDIEDCPQWMVIIEKYNPPQ